MTGISTHPPSLAQRCKVDADHVLNRLTEIDQMDIIDILNDDGVVKPISEWLKVWRQFLFGDRCFRVEGQRIRSWFSEENQVA